MENVKNIVSQAYDNTFKVIREALIDNKSMICALENSRAAVSLVLNSFG